MALVLGILLSVGFLDGLVMLLDGWTCRVGIFEMNPLPSFVFCVPTPVLLNCGLDIVAVPKVDGWHFGNVPNCSSN